MSPQIGARVLRLEDDAILRGNGVSQCKQAAVKPILRQV